MNLGFITIPFPVLIFLVIIIINIIGAIIKQNKGPEGLQPTRKKKKFGPIAYDKLRQELEDERSLSEDFFTEEFMEEEPKIAEEGSVDVYNQQSNSRKSKKKFRFNLSQLQQAVVMKEILDKPKSLQ